MAEFENATVQCSDFTLAAMWRQHYREGSSGVLTTSARELLARRVGALQTLICCTYHHDQTSISLKCQLVHNHTTIMKLVGISVSISPFVSTVLTSKTYRWLYLSNKRISLSWLSKLLSLLFNAKIRVLVSVPMEEMRESIDTKWCAN